MAPDFPAIVKRILSMTENIQITRPLGLISNKYVLVVHLFHFIFCSFEEIKEKGTGGLSVPFTHLLLMELSEQVREMWKERKKVYTKQQCKLTREDRLCALREEKQPLLSYYLKV